MDKLKFYIENLCCFQDTENINEVIIDCFQLKVLFGTKEFLEDQDAVYSVCLESIVNVFNKILSCFDKMICRIYVKGLTIIDLERHLQFIQKLAILCKQQYDEKLDTCYIYETPLLFSGIYNFITMLNLVDKKTIEKIKFVNTDDEKTTDENKTLK